MDSNEKHSKVFYGWYIVGASLLIMLYSAGVVSFGFTAVFEPIANEFGWSYAQISLAASIRGLEIGLLAPIVGLLVDRWGPRRLIFGGSILTCVGFLILSRVSSLAMFYGAFAFIAIGMSTFSQTVLMTAVTNWFRKNAGLAIGIAASGFGLGGLLVPIVTRLIDVLQWRVAMFAVGLGMLGIVLPLSFLMRHKPEHYGYQLDGEISGLVETTEDQVPTTRAEVNVTVTQAIRSRAYWHLSIGSMCHALVIGAIITHMMPYLSTLGITRSSSSLVALTVPVASIGGRLGGGWLAGRLGGRGAFTLSFALMTAGMFFFAYVTSGRMWLLVPFITTFALGWGFIVTTKVSLQREYFGTGSFGTILGVLSGTMMLANITGAPLAGWVFDTWGSYKGAWLGSCVLTTVGAVLALSMPSSLKTTR